MEVLELLTRRADEHVAHEEGMVGTGADNADPDPVALVPTSITVNDINATPGVQVVDRTLTVDFPDLFVAAG